MSLNEESPKIEYSLLDWV
jgi:hypothetical protein